MFSSSISNGEWTIDDIRRYHGTTFNNERNFSTINYQVTLTRKPGYIMFYLSPPAIVLVLLSIMSFFIPTESGERIGFITTILLALMVFLLMIPEYLPRTSDQLPILGIMLITSMVFISVVLVATILVLACHYREGRPPAVIQKLFHPFKGIQFRYQKKRHVSPIMIMVGEKTSDEKKEAMEMKQRKMTCETAPTEEDLPVQKEDEITWQQISTKLNWIFFWLICVVLLGIIIFSVLQK
ncbi:hypothetical protein QZH41_011417 [Actinostola sp. cb2023]|nr:hypothetical protein QZH41_011417 [Actinostola sp. cb2023]